MANLIAAIILFVIAWFNPVLIPFLLGGIAILAAITLVSENAWLAMIFAILVLFVFENITRIS